MPINKIENELKNEIEDKIKNKAKRSGYRQFKSRLFVGCAVILLLLIIGQVWKVRADYNAAMQTTVAQTNNLVLAIEAHVVNTIDTMTAPLTAVGETIAEKKARGDLSPAVVQSILTSPLLPATANFWLTFINAEGIGVAASNDLPVAGVSFADREYFYAQKTLLNGSLFVGAPSIGKVSQRKNYFVSKRVEGANHEFLGVIVACVDAASLKNVLQQSLYQNSLSSTIANNNGKILVRVPFYEESFGRDISTSSLFINFAKSPFGTYRALSVIDNEVRVYSYRGITKYPLVVSVGMRSPLLTDILEVDGLAIAGGLLAVLSVLFFGSRFALHSFRKVEIYATRQYELNRKLDTAQREIEASAKRARIIADNMPALIGYIDKEQRYQFRNTFYRQIPGIDYERMIGNTMLEVLGPTLYATIKSEVGDVLAGKSCLFEREYTGTNGKTVCLRHQYSPDVTEDGTVAGFYTMVTDVTDMKEVQNQLIALSRIDALTDLPNRVALYERIDEAVARNARRNHAIASTEKIGCLFLDIDRFKAINDTYGHTCGDAILKEFGSRLKSCIRQSDMVARLAGDEFVILIEGLDEQDVADSVAKKILMAMKVPFITEFGHLDVTTSIGIAISSRMNETADNLLREADSALYEAKNKGRNTFAVKNVDPYVV